MMTRFTVAETVTVTIIHLRIFSPNIGPRLLQCHWFYHLTKFGKHQILGVEACVFFVSLTQSKYVQYRSCTYAALNLTVPTQVSYSFLLFLFAYANMQVTVVSTITLICFGYILQSIANY